MQLRNIRREGFTDDEARPEAQAARSGICWIRRGQEVREGLVDDAAEGHKGGVSAGIGDDPGAEFGFEVDPEVGITASRQLLPGVVSVFSSYALDDEQAKIYEAAGECLSRAVFDAGFSQDTLLFLAGGPALGTGAVADHLPVAADQALWRSPGFSAELAVCTSVAELGS